MLLVDYFFSKKCINQYKSNHDLNIVYSRNWQKDNFKLLFPFNLADKQKKNIKKKSQEKETKLII